MRCQLSLVQGSQGAGAVPAFLGTRESRRSRCGEALLSLPPLMIRGGIAKSPNHASPYGKGRWCEAPEGIRKPTFDKVNRKADINSQKGRHLLLFFADTKCGAVSDVISRRTLRRLLVPSATDARNFGCSCLFEVRGQELCPNGAKREGKPRFSGACRAHAVVSPLNLSSESRTIFSRKNGTKQGCMGRWHEVPEGISPFCFRF